MSNAERIAALQRIAYGAGASDAERRRALDALEVVRSGAVGSADPEPPASSALGGTAPDDGATTAEATGPTPPAEGHVDDPVADEPDPLGIGALGRASSPSVMRTVGVPTAVLVGAIALAIGFSAGWATASIAAAELVAEGADGQGQDDVTFPLGLEPPSTLVGPIDETPVADVFEREPTAADLAVDPSFFAAGDLIPESLRLLATRSDGVAVWAARSSSGELCLLLRVDEVSGGSTCTVDRMFPSEGLTMQTFIQSRGFYAVSLEPTGDLRISVEGVRASSGT